MMTRTAWVTGLAAVVSFSTSALATHDLGSLGSSLPAYTGTSAYLNGGNTGTLDYAVFAPGAYQGVDPSAGTEYVYAYQAFNTTAASGMFQISVFADDLAAHNQTFTAATSGSAPFIQTLDTSGTKSFVNTFNPPFFGAGNSKVVLFTSPHEPKLGATGAIFTSGPSAQGSPQVPTPTPEPASLGLMALAGMMFLRRRH